ncbi:protein of unknown function [Ruminococcaceae bacterium BL-6]|nr:protein of unknown function [Ruminococcaceae bacterium BL-6]
MLGVVMVKNSLPSSLVTLSITVPVPSGVSGLRDVSDDVDVADEADDDAVLLCAVLELLKVGEVAPVL